MTDTMHPFLQAAINGDLDAVKKFCSDKEFDINTIYIHGQTALHFAAEKGYEEIVDFLCQQGINTDIQDNSGDTALHVAAAHGNANIIDCLHKHGASFSLRNLRQMTVLHSAAKAAEDNIVWLLLNDYQMDPLATDERGETIMHHALVYEDEEHIEQLALTIPELVNIADKYGEPPLHHAVQNNAGDIIKLLLAHGADIEAKDHNGSNAFHLAVAIECFDSIEILIGEGIDINSKGENGQTALHYAAIECNKYIVEYLLAENIDPYIKDDDGRTALHVAAGYVTLDVLSMAQDKKKKLSTLDDEMKRYAKIIRVLLHSLADNKLSLDDEDYSGNTPRHLAAEYTRDLQLSEQLGQGLTVKEWRQFTVGVLKDESEKIFLSSLEHDTLIRPEYVAYLLDNVISKKLQSDAVLRAAIGIVAWQDFDKLNGFTVTHDAAVGLSETYIFTNEVQKYLKKFFPCSSSDIFSKTIEEKQNQIVKWIEQQKKNYGIEVTTLSKWPQPNGLTSEKDVKIRRLNSLARLLALHPAIDTWRCLAVSMGVEQTTGQHYFNIAVNDPGHNERYSQTLQDLHHMIKVIYDAAIDLNYFNHEPHNALNNLLEEHFIKLNENESAKRQAQRALEHESPQLQSEIETLTTTVNELNALKQQIENNRELSIAERNKQYKPVKIRHERFKKLLEKKKEQLDKLLKRVARATAALDKAKKKQPRARRDLLKVLLSIRGIEGRSVCAEFSEQDLVSHNDRQYFFNAGIEEVDSEKIKLIQSDIKRHCEQEIARREIIQIFLDKILDKFVDNHNLNEIEYKVISIIAEQLALAIGDEQTGDNASFINAVSKQLLNNVDIVKMLQEQAENNRILIGVSYRCCPRCTEELQLCQVPVYASHDVICPTKGIFDEIETQLTNSGIRARGTVQSPSASHYSAQLLRCYSLKTDDDGQPELTGSPAKYTTRHTLG